MKGNKVYIVKDVLGNNGRFRSKIIIMKDYQFYFAEFDNHNQFNTFLDTLGIDFIMDEIHNQDTTDELIIGHLSHKIIDDAGGFWQLYQLPKKRTLIKALSNGSIVDCYFTKDNRKKEIKWYRPNPNAKNVYVPLSTKNHIAHKKIYGTY